MYLNDWAARWGIPSEALADLMNTLSEPERVTLPDHAGTDEANVQAETRVAAGRAGWMLWRNNVGAVEISPGRWLRYGLANDSKQMNERVKSSDLIGLRPVVIQPEHVGRLFGLFVARECKRPGWSFRGTAHEHAQQRFLNLVTSLGGDAAFTAGAPKCIPFPPAI